MTHITTSFFAETVAFSRPLPGLGHMRLFPQQNHTKERIKKLYTKISEHYTITLISVFGDIIYRGYTYFKWRMDFQLINIERSMSS